MDIAEIIRRGNILRSEYDRGSGTGCYLANGRFGAVFSALGLNLSPEAQRIRPEGGQSQFNHMAHWGRFRFHSEAMDAKTCADYLLPLFKLYWEREPREVMAYRQCQDFYDGVLETAFQTGEGASIRVTAWFDCSNRDLAGFLVDVDGCAGQISPIRLSAVTDFIPYPFLYKQRTAQRVAVAREGKLWCLTIDCPDAINDNAVQLRVSTNAGVKQTADGLRLALHPGQNRIALSCGKPMDCERLPASLESTRRSWNEAWQRCGWLDLPEDTRQKVWVRSMAYALYSYDDDCGMIQPTNGLTGNTFPFHFVQDMAYIAPALEMLGRGDIVMHWVERFAGQIGEMRTYAKHLWSESEGIYPPWELPFGSMEGYHHPSVPVIYCYEPHNVGYLCRMAVEAAQYAGDDAWTERFVHPLVRACAEFYLSTCEKGTDDLWHLGWSPCVGQDEAGGRNKTDYLCSLYSARYTFGVMADMGLDGEGRCSRVLKDGLAFPSLASQRGPLHTCLGADDFGRQKHPVQLDGVTYFPTVDAPRDYELCAYALRHEITARAKEPFFFGWTLAQLLLAGSILGEAEGFEVDWALLRASDYTDPEWIQFYETSGEAFKSFYVTTHGLVLQSLIRRCINDYWGRLDVGACLRAGEAVRFGGIRTRLGVCASGRLADGSGSIELSADRDCDTVLNGSRFHLKKGESMTVTIDKGQWENIS